MGMVTTHEVAISFMTSNRTLRSPLANPTPITAPTNVWVAEIGKPMREARTTTVAAENSAAKPLVGVSSVILPPIVPITRYPHTSSPATIPNPPQTRTLVATVSGRAGLRGPAGWKGLPGLGRWRWQRHLRREQTT